VEKKSSKAKQRILSWLITVFAIVLTFLIFMWMDKRPSRDFVLLQEIHEWQESYMYVDRIVVSHDSALHEVSSADNYLHFNSVQTSLNPFSRYDRPRGDSTVDMRWLEHFMQISYYIGDVKLFEVGVYLVPVGFYLSNATGRRVSHINGSRALVVLDRSGWFGSFEEYVLDICNILDSVIID